MAAASWLQLLKLVSERGGMPCSGVPMWGVLRVLNAIIHMYSGHAEAKAVTYVRVRREEGQVQYDQQRQGAASHLHNPRNTSPVAQS